MLQFVDEIAERARESYSDDPDVLCAAYLLDDVRLVAAEEILGRDLPWLRAVTCTARSATCRRLPSRLPASKASVASVAAESTAPLATLNTPSTAKVSERSAVT